MIRIIKKSIIEMNTDIIVNAANEGLWAGGGVCGAIFKAAGYDELTNACSKIGHCDTGNAVITPGFKTKAKYIIHAVGPVYDIRKESTVKQQLYNAYQHSLELVRTYDCHSIAFPLISAGIYGYPVNAAWKKALQACHNWEKKNPDYKLDIYFAVLDDTILECGKSIYNQLGI